MHYVFDLLQGLGIAAAIGIRPFLPTLLAGALAAGNIGLDFSGTDFSFLEKTPFLLAMVVCVAAFGVIERRPDSSRPPLAYILLAISLVLGALLACGSIADHSPTWWPGVPIGVAAASLGFLAAQLAVRARPRPAGRRGRRRAAALRGGVGAARRGPRDPAAAACRSSSWPASPGSCAAGAAARARSTPGCGSSVEGRPLAQRARVAGSNRPEGDSPGRR